MSLLTTFRRPCAAWRPTGRFSMRCLLAVKALEDRTVPSGGVTEFSAGISGNSNPYGITAGPDGNLWFAELNRDQIARLSPQGQVTEFGTGITPGSGPLSITAGPDGNLWFTENYGTRIGRITPQGDVTEFSNGISPNSFPQYITSGPDGNLWFTESGGDRIGRITPQGQVTEFATGIPPGSEPDGIAAGPDGNLWFTELGGDRIGRITPQGQVTEFSAGISGTFPYGITAGPDGNLWFTEGSGLPRVGRITPQGQVTEFSAGISPSSSPYGIAVGPDGNLWFAEYNGNRIGRITPAGEATEFATGISANSSPQSITPGPDGNLWFTERTGNRVGRLQLTLPTTTTLNSSAAPALYGQTVVLTATIAWSQSFDRPDPAGLVAFYDGNTLLGSGTVSDGQAVFNVNSLPAGSPHNLTAQYAGDATALTSTSPVFSEQVNPAATSVTLMASSPLSSAGDVVTYIAAVANTDTPAEPAGYVTFSDGGIVVGVSTLSGGLAAIGVSPTLAGTHHLTAAFTPAAGYQPSQTAVPTDHVVTPAAAVGLEFAGQPDFALSGKYVRGPVSVRVVDRYGNLVTGSSAPITVAVAGPGKPGLTGTRTQTAVNGVAGFTDLKIVGRGLGYTLTATSGGLTAATSQPFAVSAAVRFNVKLSAPAIAGQPFTVIVTALDKARLVDPYYQGTVLLSAAGLTGDTSGTFVPNDKGKKTFSLSLPTAGKVVLTVTDALSAVVLGRLSVVVNS